MEKAELINAAQAWMSADPDPETRDATRRMLDAGDVATLDAHFGGRLRFGTAGLRGPLAPGPNGMNALQVRQVSLGLARYAKPFATGQPVVVIGFDGRHGSREFAEDTAAVMAGEGFVAWLFDAVVATPVLSNAVNQLDATVGVMVTASHNPPQDNGYKVYWSNGAQIVPPHDKGISDEIDRVPVTPIPVSAISDLRSQGVVRAVSPEIEERYFAAVAALRVHSDVGARVVYTAMHGVGARFVETVFRRSGHTDFHSVPEQAAPDGDFPTVAFPNPEEPGAMDCAFALAQRVEADVVIANDPDADRLAVGLPVADGGFQMLTGNQVGCLLADDLLRSGPSWAASKRLVATTIVSTSLLAELAAFYGVSYVETLTGFKWIANQAITFDEEEGDFVLGFEEALGYSVGPVVRDKDGVSAALLLVDLVAYLKARGQTLFDRLRDIADRHGVYASDQHSIKMPGKSGAAEIAALMNQLRNAPPQVVGGRRVSQRRDLLTGVAIDCATGEQTSIELPESNVLAFVLDDGSRILARPSGTEPKLKFYFEVTTPLSDDETLASGEARAAEEIQELRSAWLKGLKL